MTAKESMSNSTGSTIPAPPPTEAELSYGEQRDTGKISIDDIAKFIIRVDYLTGEVSGLRTDVKNMMPSIERAVSRGVANAVIELTTRTVKLEHRVESLEHRVGLLESAK